MFKFTVTRMHSPSRSYSKADSNTTVVDFSEKDSESCTQLRAGRVCPVSESPDNTQNPFSVAPEVTIPPALEMSRAVSAEPTTTSDALYSDTLRQFEQDNDTSSNIRESEFVI
jgi:hypothetical protein